MEPKFLLPKTYCVCRPKFKRRRQHRNRRNKTDLNQQERFALILKSNGSILCRWHNQSWMLMEEEATICFDETLRIVPNNSLDSAVENAIGQVLKMDSGYDAWSLSWQSTPNQEEEITYAHVCRQIDFQNDSLSVQTLPVLLSFHCTPAHVLSLSVEMLSNPTAFTNGTTNSLLYAHLKRQLVGKVFPHSTDGVLVDLKSRRLRLKTNALSVMSQAPSSLFVMVVPSTRITIKTREDTSWSSNYDQSSLSHVTKVLIHTIQCVRNHIPVPRTFLLSGNPGVGKTYAVKAAFIQCQKFAKLVSLRGSELLQNNDSNPACALHREFHQALSAANESVVLLFLDECDALVNIDAVASTLAALLDDASHRGEKLIVVGATNRLNSVPGWLRRAGRFECEIAVLPPSPAQRHQVLLKLLRENTEAISEKERNEILRISEITVGYVPADLTALLREAIFLRHREAIVPPRRCTNSSSIVDYLERAMKDVGASSLRDATLSKPPNSDWNDVVGDPGGAKTALRQAIEWPRQKRGAFEVLGLTPPRGVLLHGPPGCSKTTLARAAAGATGVAFLSLNPAQVYASSYVGEAERIVRRSFMLAKAAAPCILFFDEVDAIFGAQDRSRGNSAEARVLSTFLNEMDGVDNNTTSDCAVLVLGATNRPWSLDSALLRPGRLGDKIVYVPPPNQDARKRILRKQIPGENDIDFEAIASMCETMTGAEIIGACQAAKIRQLREILEDESCTGINDRNHKIQQEYVVDAFKAETSALSKSLEKFAVLETMSSKDEAPRNSSHY